MVLHGRGVLSHVTRYRYSSNKMTPKDHLAAGPTRKVVVLKDLSNRTYPNPELLLITSLKSKKYFQKICHLQKMKLLSHIRLYRYHFIGNTITYLSLAGSASIMCGWNFLLRIWPPLSNGVQFIGLRCLILPLGVGQKLSISIIDIDILIIDSPILF